MSIQPRPKNPRDQKEIFSYCRKDRNTVPREGKRPSLWRSFPRKFVNFLAISLEDDGWPQNRRAETGVAFKQCGHVRMPLLTYLLTWNSLIRNPRIRQGVSSFVSTGSLSSPRGKLARTRTHAREYDLSSRLFSISFERKREKLYRSL